MNTSSTLAFVCAAVNAMSFSILTGPVKIVAAIMVVLCLAWAFYKLKSNAS